MFYCFLMFHGLLDKVFAFLWLTTLFVTWYSVLVLDVRLWNMVLTQIRNRTADHQGYNTPFSISDYVPLQYGPLWKNRIKAEHRNSVFQGCSWELAHTVVQMHCLSCNTHYYTGTWGSLNDFDFLDDICWYIPMYFTLSWKALLVSCILCRILAALNHYNWPYNGPMAIAETQGQGLFYAEIKLCQNTPNSPKLFKDYMFLNNIQTWKLSPVCQKM